jgi:hypothetical protein
MTSNRAFPKPPLLPLIALLALAACGGPAPRADERQPVHPAPPPALPLPPRAPVAARPTVLPPAAPGADWRDVPLPEGNWTWSLRADGSTARYGVAGQAPIAMLQCDRPAGMVRIAVPWTPAAGESAAPREANITTSTSSGAAMATPVTLDGQTTMAVALPVSNRLLDAMAFSRGRFRVQIGGLPPLVLPAWSEVGRVIEDCRG